MSLATDPKHFMSFMNHINQTNYKTQVPLQADITDRKPFYMVVRLGSNNYQQADASPTVRYSDPAEAAREAERLANKHASHPRGFAVVQAIAIYKANVMVERTVLTEASNSPAQAYHAQGLSGDINPYRSEF